MNCKNCGSDKLNIKIRRTFSEDDGQLETYTVECIECKKKKYFTKWGYSLTDELLKKLGY